MDSWVVNDSETSELDDEKRILQHVPTVVLVQYYDWVERDGELVQEPCPWVIEGIDRPGVYPVQPWRRSWCLDQHRPVPVLEVKRYQVPLAPAYACTAHGAQGQTLPAVIIDLCLGRGVSSIASYVAMTRVRKREDLLIFRDFDFEVFTGSDLEGPTLLIKSLRGEVIDWEEIEDRLAPKKTCTGPCMTFRDKQDFSAAEWK